MKNDRIYVETSLINRIADPLRSEPEIRREQLQSRSWWKTARRDYTFLTSTLAYRECCEDYDVERIVRLRLRVFASLIIAHVPARDRDALAAALASRRGPLPITELVDAQHIATAAILRCEHLLTWNQTHLANPYTYERVHNIVEAYGYETPVIATPEQFLRRPS
jgi:hypothetical protein